MKVGIIGTGPAGLTVAADIRREGHEVPRIPGAAERQPQEPRGQRQAEA